MDGRDGGILASGAMGAMQAAETARRDGGILASGVMNVIQAAQNRLQGASILVDTNRMVVKANAVISVISDVERTFNELQRIVNKTSGYWVGEAGNYHRKMFQDEKDNIIFILTRLKEHPDDLKLMATNFQVTERKLTEVNRQLRTDYI